MKQFKVISIFIFVLICAATLGFSTGTAQAAPSQQFNIWTFGDQTPYFPPWECWTPSNDIWNDCNDDIDYLFPYVRMYARSSFTTMGRPVTIVPYNYYGTPLRCSASIDVRPYYGSYPFTGKLEIIDARTWNYISVKNYTINAPMPWSPSWTDIDTALWTPPGKNIFVRLLLNGNNSIHEIEVRNLGIACTW